MEWASLTEFFRMGGYSIYVWGSYCVSFFLFFIELYFMFWRFRELSKTEGSDKNLNGDVIEA